MPSSDDATRKLRSGSRDPLLRLEGLCTHFAVKQGLLRRTVGQVRALDGIELRVLKGQTLAVAGEAGSGKTTLARSIARLLPATSGKVLFEGKDLLALSKSEFRALQGQIQIVSAEMLSVSEPLVALKGLLQAELKLLIFDDAFAELGDAVRLSLFEELRRQQDARGLTCLLLTRDPKLAGALADELVVLHAGLIVEAGGTASVLGHPQHPYTEALLAAEPASPPASLPPNASGSVTVSGCPFRARCPRAFARCAEEEPKLFAVPGGLSRCFLRDTAAPGD